MAILSSKKRALLIGSEGITLFGPSSKGMQRELSLAWEDQDFDQQLTDVLGHQFQSAPVAVLFDGADQAYRKSDDIPKLSMWDRPRFIKRKLEQAFPSHPVRTSIEVRDPNNKRALPSYLFAALPDTERIDKVAEDMMEAGVQVAGFSLLPAESQGLVNLLATKLFGKKGKKSRWAILIGQHEMGGLRQVVVKDGNLALTRMTPAAEGGTHGSGWVEDVIREFRGTLTYIARFGYAPEDGLDVIVISGMEEKNIFYQKALPVTNFQCLTTTEALLAIGAKAGVREEINFADRLHAAWVGRKGRLQFPIMVPSIQRIMIPRQIVKWVMIGLMFVFIGLAGFAFQDHQAYTKIRLQLEQKMMVKNAIDLEYQSASKEFNTLPIKAETIKSAIKTKELLEKSTVSPALFLDLLHKSIGADFHLTQLSFDHRPAADLVLGKSNSSVLQKIVAVAKGNAKDRGTVKMTFRVVINSQQTLEQRVTKSEGLYKTLQQNFPAYSVRTVRQFGQVSRTGKFEGRSGDDTFDVKNTADYADFEIEGPLQ